MKVDILNYQGDKIGELETEGLTSNDVAKKLAEYAKAPPAEVIPDVTPRQIKQALILSGVTLASIEAALSSLPEPQRSLAHIEWEYSTAFQRNRPLVLAVAQMLGWSSAQLDALWKMAASL